jgi:hypothetical protein
LYSSNCYSNYQWGNIALPPPLVTISFAFEGTSEIYITH